MIHNLLFTWCCASTILLASLSLVMAECPSGELFENSNLVAWCIVPFDSTKRNSEARAKMLQRLGIQKVAYDWREEHVREFEEEIVQYKKHNIEFFAFWDWHPNIEALLQKHNSQPQIWITNPSPTGKSDQDRIEAAAQAIMPIVKKAEKLKLKLGLYNHGGWGGEPRNLVAVCQLLRERYHAKQVGIVYNFHHAHREISTFDEALELMIPYLFCVNLNGMVSLDTAEFDSNKILPIGSGVHEKEMIKLLLLSGYCGPVGIIDHRKEVDAEKSLSENLSGLKEIVRSLHDER